MLYDFLIQFLNQKKRTNTSHARHAITAEAEGRVVNGVKGPSYLSMVADFDIVSGFAADYMHQCLLGVTRYFVIYLWAKKKIKFEDIVEEKENIQIITIAEEILNEEINTAIEYTNNLWIKHLRLADRDDITDVNGWLNDRVINFAQSLIKNINSVNGLQNTLFASHFDDNKHELSINRNFKKQNAPSCQIHYNGNSHWVCSYQKVDNGPVYLIDSLKTRTLNANMNIQISQIYNSDSITVLIPEVQRQSDYSDCGIFAIAFLTEIVLNNFNVDLSKTRFIISSMREHFLKCIINDEMFPKVSKMPKMPCNDPKNIKIKLYCTCKMPDIIDDMIQCVRKQCGKWFHKKCTANPTIVDNWLCSFCS
ncbi:hypothetical protein GQR58_026433 [Nymphon striatum]|nr:hypothetical protein GQR58_026433 [Nymphon striatum]